MYDMDLTVTLENLTWESDWNGYEVGHPLIDVVGLYSNERNGQRFYYYIDTAGQRLLEIWAERLEEDWM